MAVRGVLPTHYKWWALSATSLGMFMAMVNGTTLLVALPTLIRVLHMSSLLAIWVMLAYMVTQTILVLTVGRFSDMYGRKRWYVAGFALFTAASLAAGFSPNGQTLLVIRAIQAVGGSLVMGNATAIVADAFPREQLGLALGINSIVIALGQISGPILGGLLVSWINWHWVFWFNVPVGVIGTVWSWRQLRDITKPQRNQSIDYWGNFTYMLSLLGILIAITWGGIRGWSSPVVYTALVTGGLGFYVFLRWERVVSQPLLKLQLFRNRAFAMGNLSNFFIAVGRGAIILLFIFYFQGARGENALQAGISVIPMAVAMGITAPISGWLADRMGARILATVGAAVMTVSLLGFSFSISLTTPYAVIAGWLVVAGIGNGLFNSPNTSAIMGTVGPEQRGIAAGTRTMLLNTGNVFSVGTVLALVAATVPPSVMLAIFSGEPTAVNAQALSHFIHGLDLAFGFMALMAVASAVLSALRGQESKRAVTQTQAVSR
ncbi:MAG: MFS transporter [Firmicutes bacterium]|jgi:EmrB/QacA subfamily drug resistance transporter|uniref:MFS transporter n=1 Tax=Sulfobacillus benefaciens TaxID=453960 RepID=A0A2T2WSY7_9FIRM|nr:MFS transporter [Bacillota bacterium]MCL5012487.1 MFS transporter [Bacillota bacterium]PSR25365.1 MAG: MFS transporter [Sulfobacillus benefaciens]